MVLSKTPKKEDRDYQNEVSAMLKRAKEQGHDLSKIKPQGDPEFVAESRRQIARELRRQQEREIEQIREKRAQNTQERAR